eukprot:TRINITY_DN40_c0_g1_i1.p1 TRINITY_DN40_c0_g1~~TRINITY_DN40_c0_g1_i1.p1  ORF type:complete len:311 (+),score=54.01 TRINITY_DN40_c0_g1_i1:195-1127(+)
MISRGRTEPTNHIARTDLVTRVQSLGALACTSKAVFRGPFVPALMKVTHVPRNDIATLKSVMDGAASSGEPIAGVIMEPVMGEGGIFVLEPEYLQAARDLCDEHDSMLIFDEVQSGMGRTGKWFACEWAGVSPDLMALAKGLGGGVQPVGACLGSERVWGAYIDNPFIHTTTFGGNPLAMAAAIATMFVIHSENLCDAYYSLSPSHVPSYPSHVTSHPSHVTSHPSHVPSHPSHVLPLHLWPPLVALSHFVLRCVAFTPPPTIHCPHHFLSRAIEFFCRSYSRMHHAGPRRRARFSRRALQRCSPSTQRW